MNIGYFSFPFTFPIRKFITKSIFYLILVFLRMTDRKNSDSEDIRSPYQLRTTQTELKYLDFQSRRTASTPIPSEHSNTTTKRNYNQANLHKVNL